MKYLVVAWLLALAPAPAFATCVETANSYEAGAPSGDCPPGYEPLNQQTIDQNQQDTNSLNALAAQGQANEQSNGDQAAANQISTEYQQVKPKCDFVENHTAEAKLKAVADGKPPSNVDVAIQQCRQLEAMAAQASQDEQQEGITPDTGQANGQ